MLALVFPFAVLAATTEKSKSKAGGSIATPSRKKKSASSEVDATPRPAAASSAKKTGASATPKPTPAKSTDTAKDDDSATVTPAASAAKPPATGSGTGQRAAEESTAPAPIRAPAATLEPDDLREFAAQPAGIQQLIRAALALTKLNLTYTYGSADPAKGGMDCSGTMYYLLRAQDIAEVPRDSSSQYAWVRKRGPFFAVVSKSAESFEFDDLRPGDLLFWTGTYETGREIPISHVMLYLGTEKKTKKRVMFGASDGRSYAGIQRWGVSVFDFKMPREGSNGGGSRVDFVGYARIPGLRDSLAKPPEEHEPVANEPPREIATNDGKEPPKVKSAASKSVTKSAGTRTGTPKSGMKKTIQKPAAKAD